MKNIICHVLLIGILVLPATAGAGEKLTDIRACKQVLVQLEDPDKKEVGQKVAQFVCQKASELTPIFGLNKGQIVLVRIARDTNSFNRLTGRSFFTLAIFRSRGIGDMIITQPARHLGEFDKVKAVLTHELVHLMVRRSMAGRCPTWLNEGLAQWYEGRKTRASLPADEDELEALEKRWHDRNNPVGQRRKDYATSLAAVAHLIDLVGQESLLAALKKLSRSKKVLDLDLDGRSMAQRLFSDRPAAQEAQPEIEYGLEHQPSPRAHSPSNGDGMTKMNLQQMMENAKKKQNKKKKKRKKKRKK